MIAVRIPAAGATGSAAAGHGAARSDLERALMVAAALVGFVAAAGVMADNSLLTHLATGRLILERGSVPDVDPYSRFGAGDPWTVQSWLVSLVDAVVDRAVGPSAIRLFNGAIGSVIGVGLWRLSEPAGRTLTRVALTLGPLVVGVGLWSPRPLLIGLAALVGLLVLLRSSTAPVWLVVPLMWLWANSHGSFPLGSGLLGLVVVGLWLDGPGPGLRWLDPPRSLRSPRSFRSLRPVRLLGWSVVGTLLAMVGPIGPRLLTFPLAVVTRREAMEGVIEWQPPTFGSWAELSWLALALLPVLAARRKAPWADLLPSIAMVAAAALALRNVAPASIAVVAFAAPALAGPVNGNGSRLLARAVGVSAAAAMAVSVVAVAIGGGLELDLYPVEEVDRLEAAGLLPADDVVLAHREAVGNYLTLRFGASARTFVDDRFDFHDLGLLADHRDLLAGRHPREILDRRGVDVVLWEADGPLVAWLAEAPEWSLTPGEDWVVACRTTSAAFERCRTAASS